MGHARLRRRQHGDATTPSTATAAIIYKQQYNARIYQPIGTNGDFISIAGHYNQNRNNFFGSLPLRQDTIVQPVDRSDPRGRPAPAATSARQRPTASRSTATSATTRSRAA